MENKKAQLSETNRLIIIIVVAVILLFFIGTKIYPMFTKKGEIESCRFSVIVQAETELKMAGGTSPFKIDCDKRLVKFYDNRVEQGYSFSDMKPLTIVYDNKKVKKFRELDDFIVNEVVAEEMRICHYQFLEGKVEIFPNNEGGFWSVFGLSGNDDICFICSEISFDSEMENKSFSGYPEYIKNTEIPEEKKTYFEYFNDNTFSEYKWADLIADPSGKTHADIDFFKNADIKMNTTETYSLIFYSDYDSYSRNAYGVLLIPTDKVGELCEIIPN